MRYIAELERKVQTLQTEATSLSAQLTLLQVWRPNSILDYDICCKFIVLILFSFHPCVQRDTNGLSVENNELKLRVQTMEQQVHLQDGENLF